MPKVKIFAGDEVKKLESEINFFLLPPFRGATPIKILQVAQTEMIEPGEMGVNNGRTWLTITIFYEEE